MVKTEVREEIDRINAIEIKKILKLGRSSVQSLKKEREELRLMEIAKYLSEL